MVESRRVVGLRDRPAPGAEALGGASVESMYTGRAKWASDGDLSEETGTQMRGRGRTVMLGLFGSGIWY